MLIFLDCVCSSSTISLNASISGNLFNLLDKFNNKIVLSRNAKIKIVDQNTDKYSLNVPFGSKIYVNDNDSVESNQLLAEWDPYTLPIISERNGYVKYIDLKQGVSFREAMTDAIVEPIANSIWYFILDKWWTSNVKRK